MTPRFLLPLGILIIIAGVALFSSAYIVRETDQALVLQFGERKALNTDPGLYFKIPFIQNVLFYEKRVLNLDPPTERVLLADQKPLLVDSYARYRIQDALRFYQAVRTEQVGEDRLSVTVNSAMRAILGNETLASILSQERTRIMTQIQERVNSEVENLGMEIVDVRIRRTDLPDATSQAVYDRMVSEREREAREFRAQGEEQAQRIRATADREATVIRAEAEREAEILRGEGDAERTRILSAAYGQDQAFFRFYRSMQAYREGLSGDNSTLVLSPDNEFLRYFNQSQGGETAPEPQDTQ
ncbi:protease modulator HflC [Fodinicurvata halophila]|uniref:Protein HflC n=1 Tax=Fodinicurvata halophila TaxID=1419723 RepID=A0ABV8UFZ4_9PROT